MSTSELLAAFEAKTSDHRAFEALVKQALADGDRDVLSNLFERLPEWAADGNSPLVRVLSQQARTSDDEAMAAYLYFQVGMVLWKAFGDEQKAEMSFRKIKARVDDPEPLREFYLAFYVKQQNWRRLEQFLVDPVKGGLDDAIEVKRMLGRLATEHEQPDRAITFWQGVRGAEPLDEEAEAALTELYQQVGKWHAMVDLLKDKLKRLPAGDVDDRIALHTRMIGIYKDHLRAPSKVVAAWQSILEIDPGNTGALDALGAEYEEMKRWPDLVKVLQQKIDHAEDTEFQISLHRRIATIMMEKFSNSTEAIKHYQAILELDTANREAIEVLKEIYDSRRDWDNYIQVAEREIALVDDPAERQEAYLGLARLASERIRKPATPILLWERVLEGDGDHVEALSQLEALYEREKRWDRLAEVQERRAALSEDAAEKGALLEKLGQVYTSRLDDPEKASLVWRRLLELDASHRKAQAELRKKFLAEHAWDDLEWFFRNYGTVQEWVRTLETQAKGIKDEAEKTELLFKAAALWQEELGDVRRATKDLESVLALNPSHALAAQRLVPIYQELRAWKKLPNVYDIVLEATEDAETRRQIFLDVAALHEEKLHDVDRAFFAYVNAIRETPNAVSLYPEFRRLAERGGNWDTYVEVLGEAVELIEDESARIDVLLDTGGVFRDQLEERDAALNAFNRVIDIDDGNRAALEAIEALYRDMGAFDQLIGVYDKKLRIARDGDERRDILFLLAAVWRVNLENNEEAHAIYREMLDDYPTDVRVHDALCVIYLDEGRHAPMVDVLARKRDVLAADDAPGLVLADLECQLGLLAYGTEPEPEGVAAAVGHFEAALGHDATHEQTIRGLEELVADDGQRLRIAAILEPIYAARADWRALTDTLEVQLVGAVDDDDTARQIELLERLTGLYRGDDLGDEDLAWRSLGRHFRLAPDRADVREGFEQLTEGLDRWDRMVAIYTGAADDPAETDTRLAIKLAVARAWHRRLEDLEQARVFFHKVLDEAPEHDEALDALESIYGRLDRAADLLDVYRRKVELSSDPGQKLDYLFRTCDLLRDRLDRHEDAIDAAREALELAPDNVDAMQRLDELFTRTEQWHELAGTIERTLGHVADDTERVATLSVRLAAVTETRLEETERAIELYAGVLDIDPSNLPTVVALERLFDSEDWAPTIAPILQPYYDRENDWQSLVDVYRVREGAADMVDEKVDWHYRIAALYEERGEQADMAFEHFALAASLDPGNEKTLAELLRLAEPLENHGELVMHLQGLVEEIDDDTRRRETHRTIAGLARDRTGDLNGAEKHLRAILEIDPGDMPAIDALTALYRQTGNTEKLVEMLLMKAPMLDATEPRIALYAEAGQLSAAELGDAVRAIEIYQTLHSIDEARDLALDALENLYTDTEDWDQLVDVYREKISRAEDLDTRKAYAAMLGHVQAGKQEAADDAVMTWRTILEWDPADLSALDELDGLYVQQEDWYSLQDTLLKKQALVDDNGWVDAQFRLAQLFESDDQLSDIVQAIGAHAALLERRPGHDGSVASLKSIIADRDEREQAFTVLRPVLAGQDKHEDLWTQYEVIATHQVDDPINSVRTLHEMADLAEGPLADPDRAFGAAARAFAASPRDQPTVDRLEGLADQHALLEELVALYDKGAEEADDDFLALELRLKVGSLLMDRIGDAERAVITYQAIREDNPDHAVALGRLHQLYEGQGMAPEFAGILRQQADLAPGPGAKIAFLGQLARVSEEALGNPDAAYEAYIEILDFDRGSDLAIGELWRLYVDGVQRLDIAYRLEPIYTERESWDDLHALLELKLEAVEDSTDRMEIMRQLAELNLERLGRKPEAIIWFGRAFRLDPEDEFLLQRLTQLSDEIERWDDLRRILMDAAAAVDEDQRRVELWHRAAALSRDRLDDPAESERVYRLVLELSDDDYAALSALDALLTGQERWLDLEPVLSREAAVADYDEERIALLMRLAELYSDRLDRRSDAVASYAQILDLNDMHRPALLALEQLYREDGSWEKLYEVLQQLADTSNVDADRVRYTGDMARLAESQLDQADKAVELWEEVLTLAHDDLGAVHELQRLLQARENWEPLVDAYERELRIGVEDGERRLDLYKRLGRVLQGELDDGFRAQTFWEKARVEAPHDQEALEALRVIYRDGYNFEGLAGVLRTQLATDHYDHEPRLGIWRELGEVHTESLVDPTAAIEAWRHVLELAPTDPVAMETLQRLYEQEELWADAVELERVRLANTTERDARVETWLHIARLQHDKLGDAGSAAATYVEVLEAHPEQLDASQRLEAIYEGAEQWAELADLLLARTEHLPDAHDRLLNLQRLARVYEHRLDQPENAFLVLSRANEDSPDDQATLDELARLAEATSLWQEMLDVYDATLPHVEDDQALDVMLRAAVIVRERLERSGDAVAYFQRVLEHDDENEQALRALVQLNQQLERWPALVTALQKLSEVTPDYGERVQLLRQAADVQELNLGDADAAVATWYAILELDELERTGLNALERLHTERDEWKPLIEILDTISRVDPQRGVELNLRIAAIWDSKLGSDADAIERYEEVLNFEPGNADALAELERLYGQNDDWGKLVDVYERSFDAAQTDEEMARNIALLQREIFKDLETSADWHHRVLQLSAGDEAALDALDAIYRESEAWDDLIQLGELKREAATDADGRAAALVAMAEVYRTNLDDVDNAISTYERVQQEVSGHTAALDMLEDLYAEQGLHEQVIDVLQRKLAVTSDLDTRLGLICQQGSIALDELANPDDAARHYDRALAEQAGHEPAIAALIAIYTDEERFDMVVHTLGRKLESLTDDGESSRVHVEMASVWREKLFDTQKALEHLEAAVEADPESQDALWPLADHYMGLSQWTKAMPLLDVLADRLEQSGDDRVGEVHKRIARCAEALLDNDRAVDHYEVALQQLPNDGEVLRGLARLRFKKGDYQAAERLFSDLVERAPETLDDDDFLEVHMGLGECALKLGEIDKAKGYLSRVVEHQPHNATALTQIAQVFEAYGDWDEAISYKERLIVLLDDPLQRFTVQMSVGDIYREKLGDRGRAVLAYEAALDHGERPKAPLLQLVQIYAEQSEYPDAVRCLNRLIEAEAEPRKKALYAKSIAVMYRDKLNDPEQAIRYYNVVLDFDLESLDAFRAVDELLTRLKDWKALEQNYRRMLQRVQAAGASFEKGTALLFTLYKNLGEIYRSRLKNVDYAISAYELASGQRPRDEVIREILAGLYESGEDKLDKAVEQHRFLIHSHPDRFDSYHRLFRLYRRMAAHDRAWCVAGLLCALEKADADEAKYYRNFTPNAANDSEATLDQKSWLQWVMSPKEDPSLGRVFALLYQSLGKYLQVKTLKDLGLKKRDRMDLDQKTLAASTLRGAGRQLGITLPDVYLDGKRMGFEVLPTLPANLAMGSDMQSGRSDKELAFYIGKRLTYCHPWRVMATLYEHQHLDVMFMAAAMLVDASYQVPMRDDIPEATRQARVREVGDVRDTLDKAITPQTRKQLAQVMADFHARQKLPKIGTWHRHLELSANHAGLHLAGDIELVGRILKDEVSGSSKLSRGDKLKDLVQYVLSDRYAELRKATGVEIEYSELLA